MARKIKLLIVDDEARFLETLARRLSLRDFDVTTAESGREAIEAARQTEFDVAVLDLKMPGMSGEDVLQVFRRDQPRLEVVILTGHGSIDSAVKCTQAGSYSYLQKPCEIDELLDVLQQAYRKRVEKKLRLESEKLDELMNLAIGESPLGILRRLREIEESGGK